MHSHSISIKNEEQDISVTNNNIYQQQQQQQQLKLPACLNGIQHHFYDQTSSARTRSVSSSVIQHPTVFPHYTVKNPMSVQPVTKQIPLTLHGFDESRLNNSNGLLRFDPIASPQIFSNASIVNHYDDNIRKSVSSDNYSHNRPVNILHD
jgi:hypothetical protein